MGLAAIVESENVYSSIDENALTETLKKTPVTENVSNEIVDTLSSEFQQQTYATRILLAGKLLENQTIDLERKGLRLQKIPPPDPALLLVDAGKRTEKRTFAIQNACLNKILNHNFKVQITQFGVKITFAFGLKPLILYWINLVDSL